MIIPENILDIAVRRLSFISDMPTKPGGSRRNGSEGASVFEACWERRV